MQTFKLIVRMTKEKNIFTLMLILFFNIDVIFSQTNVEVSAKRKQDSLEIYNRIENNMKLQADSIAEILELFLKNDDNCNEYRAHIALSEDKIADIKKRKYRKHPEKKDKDLLMQFKIIEEYKIKLKNCE